mgnify:CR=1 FL=1
MESYYNQSFVDRIKEAQSNIDNLVAEKDKSWSATGQKQDEYNAFKGTMSSYDEVYTQSKSEFGIEEHRENYEKSKQALALAESTLSALPSSINSSSNRVLTQSQREARYNTLSNRAMAYRDNLLARSSAYEEVWKKAREEQATYTKAEIASQYGKLGDYNNAFVNAMNEYDQATKRLTQGKVELAEWQHQYREWQQRQWEREYTIWSNNLRSALDRYQEALSTEMLQNRLHNEPAPVSTTSKSSGAFWSKSQRVKEGSDTFITLNSMGELYLSNSKTGSKFRII